MKKILQKTPIIGYPYRLFTTIIRLPRKIHEIHHEIHLMNKNILDLQEKTTTSNEKILDILQKNK